MPVLPGTCARSVSKARREGSLPLTFQRSGGEAGLRQAHSKHPSPFSGPVIPNNPYFHGIQTP